MPHNLFAFALTFAGLAAPFAHAQLLGTAFTYQGRLDDGGNPANGSYDLQFTLYREESGGSSVAGPICDENENVDVQDGLFTAWVDFGPAVFNGEALWLEIGVRADSTAGNCGTGAYTPLTPRQALTATPYALHTRGIFVDNAGKVGIGTTAPIWRMSVEGGGLGVFDAAGQGISLTSDSIAFANATNEDPTYRYTYTPEKHEFYIGGGAAMTLNASGLTVNSFMGSGAGLTGVNAELLDGLDSTVFLRSMLPLTLSAPRDTHILLVQNTTNSSGAYAIRGEASGGLSFGNAGVFGQSAGLLGTGVYGASTSTGAAGGFGVQGHSASTTGRGVYGSASAATGATYGGFFKSASTDGLGVFGQATAATGTTYGLYGESASTAGRGVHGEATAAGGFTYGGRFHSASTNGRGVYGEATAATGETYGGRFHSASANGRGIYGAASAVSGTNFGIYGETASPNGFAGYFAGGKNYFEGRVGIGTETPERALDVVGRMRLRQDTPPSGGNSAGIDFYQQTPAEDRAFIGMRDDDQIGLYGRNGSGWSFVMDVGTGNVGIGTTSPQAKLHVDGNTRLDGTVFIAPIRRWLSVHYSAFNPYSNEVEFDRSGYVQHLSPGLADFNAPVQLPDGANIISMTAYLIDQQADHVLLELRREPLAGDTIVRDVICAVSSTGTGAHSRPFTDSTPNTAFDHVDNNLYVYSLNALIPFGYGVRGVVIEYEIDRPLP